MTTGTLNPALQSLVLANDLQVTRAAEYIYEQALGAMTAAGDATPLTEPVDELVPLRNAVQQGEQLLLSDAESVAIARWSLMEFAGTPGGQALVQRALTDWRDDTQRVGVRLQWTLAGTLILLVATTEIEYGPNGLHIHKKTVIPQQLEATLTFIKTKVSMKVFDPAPPTSPAVQGPAPAGALPPASP